MKTILSAAIGAMLALSVMEAGAQNKIAERKVELAIEQQSLADALNEWAKQTGLQLVSSSSEMMNTTVAPQVKGAYTAQGALEELLKGTTLTYEWVSERAVAIREKSLVVPAALQTTGAIESVEVPRLQLANLAAQEERGGSARAQRVQGGESETSGRGRPDADEVEELEEIVVTGTHIRGAGNSSSPIQVYSRDDIDRRGAGTVKDFVQHLASNFNGGASEDTIGDITGGSAANSVGGTSINLRGLGPGTTLILVDGRRLAPGNVFGNFVDISLIPLSAVERVEIVPDGTSAIYGSDATGGVVNFIMRKAFQGAETRARGGWVSSGDSNELEAGQTLGADWGSGSALVTYEYFDRSALEASERTYTSAAVAPTFLIPEATRHSAFGSINQRLDSGVSLFATGTYGHRTHRQDFGFNFGGFEQRQRYESSVDAYSVTAGGSFPVFRAYDFELSSSYAASDTHAPTSDPTSGEPIGRPRTQTSVWSIDPVLTGALFNTNSGPVRIAFGAQYRREEFDNVDMLFPADRYRDDRSVAAAFLEFRVPILARGDQENRTPVLELTLADRYEKYSDFGSTNNPKFGLSWDVLPSLKLRGTYGTSFKAPNLNDLNPALSLILGVPMFDPEIGDLANTVAIAGGNANLDAEEATTTSIGIDFRPVRLPSTRLSATYYDIRFENRIQPGFNAISDPFDALSNAALLGPTIVQRDTSAAQIQALMSDPGFSDFGLLPGPTSILIDYRAQNLSTQRTSGIDLEGSVSHEFSGGTLEYGANVTRILDFETKQTPVSPAAQLLDTPYNPISWKGSVYGAVNFEAWRFATFINYVDSYRDTRDVPVPKVGSWTTIDVNAAYQFSNIVPALGESEIALGVRNAFDKDPPFVANNPANPINYDGANANALGRFFYLQLTLRL